MAAILYFDDLPGSLGSILRQHVPNGFELWPWDDIALGEREEKLATADYIVVGARTVDSNLIASAKNAKLLQKIGVGTDNIDLAAAARQNLTVANAPGGNAGAVAELTILMALALFRRLRTLDTDIRVGKWSMWEYRSRSFEIQGKVHGIVGLGAVGQEVARRSHALGTDVLYHDIQPSQQRIPAGAAIQSPLEDLLRKSDIVSVHVPLTPQTHNLIDANELALMKREAVLVNVARGRVVNEAALHTALKNGQLAGAGIDVWDREPVARDHPLLQLENVIATPHVGAGTREAYERVLAMAMDNIRCVAAGMNARNTIVQGKEQKS